MEQEIEQMTQIYNTIVDFLVNYSFQLIGAMVILLLGLWLAAKVSKWVLALCQKKDLDITLSKFIASTIKVLIIVMVAIICLGKLGISVTPFVAAVGALSLGAGLAVQGLLSNYGAGFNIIITRPFVVGDTIEVQGVRGIVADIHLAFTELTDEDNVHITIPNKHIVGEIIHNSKHDSLLELGVGISYNADPEQAISAIRQALAQIENLSTERELIIGIDEFGDSSVNIRVRAWAKTAYFYQTKFIANQVIYQALQQAKINIPYPQRDVHMVEQGEK
jgi:small conductance mechanosensitive channel